MKSYHINGLNAITLIVMGLIGYLGSASPSNTALIPVAAGVLLLVLTKGLKIENKTIAHIVVALTLLMLIALFKPLSGAISRNNHGAVLRVLAMMITCSIALVFYAKSFINARKK
jgi:hypothetical protein